MRREQSATLRKVPEPGQAATQGPPRTLPPPPSTREAPAPVGRRLGDLIIAEGLLTPAQLGDAIAEQRRRNDKLGTVLVSLGLITEEQLVHVLSRQYGIPAFEIPDAPIASEILGLVPGEIARKYELIPVARTLTTVTLAIADPTNLSALDEVAFRTALKVVAVIARPSAIRQAIDRSYEAPVSTLATLINEADAEASKLAEGKGAGDLQGLRASADQLPVVRLVNTILLDAIQRGASDIHVEPEETSFRIRLRIDGVLQDVTTPPKRLEAALVSRIKIMSNLDIAERRLPQDGRLKFRYNDRDIDFRVSLLPTIFGESVVLRILDKDALKLDLSQLGFDPWSLEHFQKAIRHPHGMILITGPTGAGKTTTLYSALSTVNSPDIHIVTLEDPVEYNLKGINQVQVNEEAGLTFATALRSFLRHDPDVILVGEMRDFETAQIAVRASLTGHLVLSTLHTNDCASTVARLLDMGIPPFLLSSSLRLIVAQRLARKVCRECKEAYQANEDTLIPYGHTPQGLGEWTFYKGKGCPACNFTGMKGRVALYEVMPISREVRDLILQAAPPGEICKVARDQGMKTLREFGLMKVMEGVTTVDEVLRVTSE